MRELVLAWRSTRGVVLVAMTAALYAAILIPFKVLPIVPGLTEFRPANAVPVVCSFLFGPAAAFGSAIGNGIGDLFGGIGPGDVFGLLGNFLYGLLPYRLWRALSDRPPTPRSAADWARMSFAVLVASGACALVIGWGLNLLGFVPFPVLANVILWNNFLVAIVLSPLLLRSLHPRVAATRLAHGASRVASRPAGARGIALLLAVAVLSGHVAGNAIYLGAWTPPWVAVLGLETANRSLEVGLGLAPIVALVVLLAILL